MEPSNINGNCGNSTTATARNFASGFDAPSDLQADEELFEATLGYVAREFPRVIAIEGTHVLGRAANIEHVKVGDPLILAADWQNPYFDPACIEVFDASGNTLGNLNELSIPAVSGNRELACLLPYITAIVESVTPLSRRRKGAKHALMDIRLEIDQCIFVDRLCSPYIDPAIIQASKKLLSLPPAKRVVLSKGPLTASNLNGFVVTTQAEDIVNPLGSTYENPGRESAATENDPSLEPVEEIDGRQETIDMLKMFVMAGTLIGNVTFPPELLDELKRAENGDESVDLEDLARRLNELTPNYEAADLTSVSFESEKTVSGRRFSVAVPDGWTAVGNYEEKTPFELISRPFVMVQGEVDGASDLQSRDRIIYVNHNNGDDEVPEFFAQFGIADLKWALTMHSFYDNSNGNGLMGMRPNFVWDVEVEAMNTRCLVLQSQVRDGTGGLEFYVIPYALDHNDMLRFVFTYENENSVRLARALVKAIARTVSLDKPIVPECEQTLERALTGKVCAADFEGLVGLFAKPYMSLRQFVFAAYRYKYAGNTDNFDEGECLLSGARGIAELNRRAALTLDNLMDAYGVQVSVGATTQERDEMLEALSLFKENAIADESIFEDNDAKKVAAAGVFEPTEEMLSVEHRFACLKERGELF